MGDKQAMILAAGMGTRLKPWTDHSPKALFPFRGMPMLRHVLEKLQMHGFGRVVINIHHRGEQILEYLKANRDFGMQILISDERDELRDTGGGLKKASALFDPGPVLVHNVDIFSDLDLGRFYQAHIRMNAAATLAVRDRETSRSLLMNDAGLLCGWRDNRSGEEVISRKSVSYVPVGFSGIYVVSEDFLQMLPERSVYPLMPEMLRISEVKDIALFRHDEGVWFDMGKGEKNA